MNGDLCVSSPSCPSHSGICLPPDGSFIIRDSSDTPRIYIDSNGNVCLTGYLFEGATP